MRKRISRHIERCAVCGERKRRELTPALFAGAMPLAALFPGFREQVLRMLADRSPAGLAHRLTVANRAAPFGPNGFPKPIRPPGTGPWHRVLNHPHALVAGAATVVIAAGTIAVGIIAGPHHGPSPGAAGGSTHGASISTASPLQARGGPSGRGGYGPPPATSTPDATTALDAFRSSGAPGLAPASTNPSSAGGSSSTSSSPSSSRPSSPTSAGAGTLSASTGQLGQVSVNGIASGTFTLTAHGGPVNSYTVTVGSTLAGHISVSPSSGLLASGASVTITVSSTSLVALDGQLTVNPGGETITVLLSLGL